ncbi:glycoside hydrolase [Dichotomopilus funicola]|uniref:Glycoside hydrolase n=1 Tax=Dichotomopilus funicola TaxID=1934379 RepID=A0AAN6ZQV7_9PEZI|nr:glycoside hydrolase [Dichotomopilus funicola]
MASQLHPRPRPASLPSLSLSSLLTPAIALLWAATPFAHAAPALTDDSQCGCYLTNDTDHTYFTEHRFFDFRKLSEYAHVTDVIGDFDSSSSAPVTSDYFKTPEWTDFWLMGTWNNTGGASRPGSSVDMVNSPNNIYISPNDDEDEDSDFDTYLTLRTQRLSSFQTSAEIESASSHFKYLSLRMLARTIGSPGAITAMFTYRGATSLAQVQESDLEIRTSDPRNLLHYTNQPAYTDAGAVIPDATRNATMPDGRDWSSWAVHRLDWTPGLTTWYVDDEEVASIAFQAPRDESTVILNAWSDGGGWTGNMTVFDAAFLQVQWLEVVFNNSETVASSQYNKRNFLHRRYPATNDTGPGGNGTANGTVAGCVAVCSVDRSPELGKPVMLWNNAGVPVRMRATTNGGKLLGWVPVGLAVGMVLFSTGFFV